MAVCRHRRTAGNGHVCNAPSVRASVWPQPGASSAWPACLRTAATPARRPARWRPRWKKPPVRSATAKLTAPIPLARIRAHPAPKAGLGDDLLALLAILREDPTTAPAGALELVAASLERIGAAIERQSLE